ncbi:MAG TPA: serine hydroxymethyltransferase [Tenericutes bacterium]|nr:serine hydroxymethyltransferase [Mycoplasmatota bacterium]
MMDPNIFNVLKKEEKRQQDNLELIASENFVSDAIRELQGSIFTNKYAEGYPNRRYYGGCENVDVIETLAIDYATKLFNCNYANVQPHSGSSANMAVYRALLNHNDKILGMNLSHGGHLTHGHSINFSGIDYEVISYNVDEKTGEIDYEKLIETAKKEKPKLIVAGASAYSKIIDFKKFKEAADTCGALLMVDMAHIAGLVAAGLHPNPFPYADVVTSTTHKTLRGPRGGLILTNKEEIIKKINKVIFPGIQGGPLMHVIAAKAQCFYEALQPEFKIYQENVLNNMQSLIKSLKEENFTLISNGSENHLVLINTKESVGLTGKEAEEILDKINITVNKNTIPYDTESPNITSGIRVGTAAMTTKGLNEIDFYNMGKIISEALRNYNDIELLERLKEEVLTITKK